MLGSFHDLYFSKKDQLSMHLFIKWLCNAGVAQSNLMISSFLNPPVHFARWAHMHHFAAVRPSGLEQKSDWEKIHNS